MINKTKTIYLLRNQLRNHFAHVEQLQEQKIKSVAPQSYIMLDGQIYNLKQDIETLKELIRFLDNEEIT
jgi:predicted nucleotidyltransferase